MGLFGDQAERLLRESWSGPDELAEELYAIFSDTGPLEISSPVQISTPQGSTVPPLTLKGNGIAPQAISIQHSPVPSVGFGEIPQLPPLPDIGGVTLTSIYNDGSGETWAGDPQSPPATTPGTGTTTGGGGGGFPGQVTGGGPGQGPYQVSIYPKGLAAAATKVNVTQLSIDPAETIPAGTWTMVFPLGKSYVMQVPVWL